MATSVHVGIFGEVNSGKSTLLNLLVNQSFSITSSVKGTTTDPVFKNMELMGFGIIRLVDTAGFEDETKLSEKRIEKTLNVLDRCSLAIVVKSNNKSLDTLWYNKIKESKVPILEIINNKENIDCSNKSSREKVLSLIYDKIKHLKKDRDLTSDLVKPYDTVLLVMPQDKQAPNKRLILPQQMTIRSLIGNNCVIISCDVETMPAALLTLKEAPALIITDSQSFHDVYALKPESSKLTSFSILMAKSKSDINILVKGALAIDEFNSKSRILIAEACTHAPADEDIGTVKIPRLFRKRFGDDIVIDFTRGESIKDKKDYDLVIFCGSCMFNTALVEARLDIALRQNKNVSNYGIVLSYFNGILNKIVY